MAPPKAYHQPTNQSVKQSYVHQTFLQKPKYTASGQLGLKEAIARYGAPEIFNTDQGSQFTSGAWIDALTDAKIRISMDGKGAWRDNRMIERLWRSLKYECVYLNAFETGSDMRAGIGKWLAY